MKDSRNNRAKENTITENSVRFIRSMDFKGGI